MTDLRQAAKTLQVEVVKLKQMLEQQQAEPVADDMAEQLSDALDSAQFYRRRVEALQAWQRKLRDPERIIVCDILANGHTLDPAFAGDRYITSPKQQAEPVAWRYALDASVDGPRWIYIDKDPHQWLKGPVMAGAVIETLYTTQPQRPWQGLTDEEMSDTVADMDVDFGDLLWKVVCLTKIIEAKLKERNGY